VRLKHSELTLAHGTVAQKRRHAIERARIIQKDLEKHCFAGVKAIEFATSHSNDFVHHLWRSARATRLSRTRARGITRSIDTSTQPKHELPHYTREKQKVLVWRAKQQRQ
jgi:hypothetical protein